MAGECIMKLKIPGLDIRRLGGSIQSDSVDDEETGKSVGRIVHASSLDGNRRRISLFDGKYEGSFKTHEECIAFARGVEAVLNHMVSLKAGNHPSKSPHSDGMTKTRPAAS
jgi:hypothetical protein